MEAIEATCLLHGLYVDESSECVADLHKRQAGFNELANPELITVMMRIRRKLERLQCETPSFSEGKLVVQVCISRAHSRYDGSQDKKHLANRVFRDGLCHRS